MFFDIHSHVLPEIDDGAENLNEALKILKLMQSQGITDVIATPHFYPSEHNLEDFEIAKTESFKKLTEFSVKRNLPRVYLGCELLYFRGLCVSESLNEFCLNGSEFLLLELTEDAISEHLFDELVQLREKFGIEPIIAHVERYCGAKKYKKFIKFLIEKKIPVQINAGSVLIPPLERVIKKLLDSPLDCVIASDAHSTELRPPHIAEAMEHIEKKYGENYRTKLEQNSKNLFEKIISKGALND